MERYYFVRSRGRCLRPQTLGQPFLPRSAKREAVVVLIVADRSDGITAMSLDHGLTLYAELRSLLEQTGSGLDDRDELDRTQPRHVVFPRCVIADETDAVVATGISARNVTLFELRRAKQLSVGWPSDKVLADQHAVVTLIERYLKTEDEVSVDAIIENLANQLEAADVEAMREELGEIYGLQYQIGTLSRTVESMPEALRRIIGLRLRLSELRNIVAGSKSTRPYYERALTQNVSELDSLGLVSMSGHLFELQLLMNNTRKLQQEQAYRQQFRDRRLTQWVAAFVLPTLWLSLLGINLVPARIGSIDLQTNVAFVAAGLIAVALGFVGWFFVRLITGRSESE